MALLNESELPDLTLCYLPAACVICQTGGQRGAARSSVMGSAAEEAQVHHQGAVLQLLEHGVAHPPTLPKPIVVAARKVNFWALHVLEQIQMEVKELKLICCRQSWRMSL